MIYKNILARCEAIGMNISALEKTIGLGNGTIKGWQTSSPRVDKLKKVAEFFECSIDDLMKEE